MDRLDICESSADAYVMVSVRQFVKCKRNIAAVFIANFLIMPSEGPGGRKTKKNKFYNVLASSHGLYAGLLAISVKTPRALMKSPCNANRTGAPLAPQGNW